MGKKPFSGMACLLLALAVSAGTGCNRDKKIESADYGSVSRPVLGDLAVISATPRGETRSLSDAGAFVVVFDHPMTALEAATEGKGSSFLRIKPGIRGKIRWIGTRALTFIPDAPLPYATRYEVTVPAGTRSIDDFSLPRDEAWTFETPLPRVVGHYPLDDEQSLRPDTKILVAFNQPVSPPKARKSIALTGTDPNGKSVDLDFKVSRPDDKTVKESGFEAPPSQVLCIEPRALLKPDFGYKVEVREGLAVDAGSLRSAQSFSFGFETFKTFRFESLDYGRDNDPHEPLKLQFSNPVVYKKIVEAVSFEPAVAIPDYYSAWDQPSPSIWLNLPFLPETEYTLRIPAGLEDDFGNKLGQDIVRRFKTPSFSPSVTMTTGYGVVESYADPQYPIFAMNADKVLVQAANIRKDGVIPLLTMPKIFWTNESIRPGSGFSMEKTIEFKTPRNQSKAVPLDLTPLLKGGKGLVFLQLDTESAAKYERYPKAFIQVTDLGISAKFSPENNVIWATELRSGLPVGGADVELRDDANAVLWRGRTDGDGRAETPGWRALGIRSRDEWSKPQQWVFVSRGQDTAIASSEWGTGVYPYRFGIEYDWNPVPETVRGYLFTERGIYRSGETVHIKGILRRNEQGRWALPSAREVDFEIVNPFEKSVSKIRVPVDGFGSFHLDFETAPDASLGLYRMTASVPPEGGTGKPVLVSDSFRVEAFRPAEFEVHLRTLQEDYVFGGDYRAGLRANYLSGGALANQKVSWHLRLNATGFQPPGHEGYAFGNGLDWDEEPSSEGSRLLASGEAKLDARGELEVRIPLVPEKEKDSVSATLEATVESPSRRTVSSRIQTVVHRGDHYIGLQPSTSFLEQGKPLSLNVIAVDPRGGFLKGRKISVRLFRREWRSVRQAGVGGRFRWHTEKEDIEVAARTLESKEGPAPLEFKPEKSGLYFFKAEGKDGRGNDISSSTYVYVTGKDYVSWEQRDDDTIEIVPDKESYRPGETAKLLVKSPYENAKALVTVEREFIIESRILEIRGSSSHIGIPIKADHIPNVFVSVLLVQGRTDRAPGGDGQDVGQPSFKMGYAKLSVSPLEKKLKVDLSRDRESYGPKESVTLRIKVRDAADAGRKASVALAVVDVGVLNIIGYQTPDVFAGFYGEKPLSVETSETRLHVVGQRSYGEKGEDAGGGGEKMLASSPALSEVELRKDFKSTAYWNPSIETDDEGAASVTFDLPANLTTFRVMAVAQTTASDFGLGEELIRVSKSLQLQPSLPRFARAGDEFEGGVVVRNLSDKPGTVSLRLDAEGIRCSDSAPRTLNLEAGEAREVLFRLKAELPGRAGLAFRAAMGDETDGLEIVLPVHLPRALETVAFSGQTDGAVREFVKIPGDAFAEEGRLDVQASPTALGGLKGSLDYLENYPYLCLEQRLSRLLPYLAASNVIFDFRLTPLDAAAARKIVQTGLRDIYEYQTDEGAFGAWTDASRASPFLSAYAVFALIKAREAGYEVDSSRLDTAVEYLKSLLREESEAGPGPYGVLSRNTTMAFVVYDLALLGQPEPAYAERLFKDRENLSLFGKTMLFKSFRLAKGGARTRDLLLEELMNMIRVAPADAHFEEAEDSGLAWIYSSNLRTTAFILQALVEAGSDHPLIPQIARWIVNKKNSGRWGSTQENFYVLYALNEFYRKYEKAGADFSFGLGLDSKVLLEGVFRKIDAAAAFRSTKLADFGSGTTLPLDVHKEGAGTLYYDVRMTYAPRGILPAADQGIAVVKRLETPAGKPVSAVRAGDLVVVTLDIVVPQESLFVVVDDPLPAGFEAVNPVFATESEEALRALDGLGGEEVWWEGFNHTEMRDERVLLFADSLKAGLHTHRYLVRALTPGAFRAPGTKVEEMYAPEVFGRGAERVVTIEK